MIPRHRRQPEPPRTGPSRAHGSRSTDIGSRGAAGPSGGSRRERTRHRRPRRHRARGAGQEGRPDCHPARYRRAARRGPAQGRARPPTQVRERGRGGAGRDPGAPGLGRARRPPGGRGRRRHDARSPDPSRVAPPDRGDGPRDRGRLRPVRLRRLRGPGDRGRRHQLPDAQHPAGPPCPRPLGHALPRHRGPPAAHPHEPGPDPRDAPGAAADPRPAPGPLLPLRGRGREPRAPSSSRSRG